MAEMNESLITLSFIDARIEHMILPAVSFDEPFWYLAVIFDARRADWRRSHRLVIVQQIESESITQKTRDMYVELAKKKAYDTVLTQKGEPE